MAETSKELLDQPSKPPLLEALLVGSKDSAPGIQRKKAPADGYAKGRLLTTAVPKSQVLGKIKDFLGVMANANEKLQLDAQENSRADYDIEVLSGNKQEYIEMDLLLGVADLHTAEALAAAEASMSGFQPSGTTSSSDTSDPEDDDSDKNDDSDDEGRRPFQLDKALDSEKDELMQKNKPNKRPKIVVLN